MLSDKFQSKNLIQNNENFTKIYTEMNESIRTFDEKSFIFYTAITS